MGVTNSNREEIQKKRIFDTTGEHGQGLNGKTCWKSAKEENYKIEGGGERLSKSGFIRFGLGLRTPEVGMRLKRLDNRGMIWTWITILIAFFIVIVIYIALDHAVRDFLLPQAENLGLDPSLKNELQIFWDMFPFAFMLALFIFGLLWASRDNPYARYY